ncbi:MAG: TonB family protein [Pseudomonadota bacterium]
MNYVASSRRPNPAAMLGALGVPAAFGAILVAGLAVTVVLDDPQKDLTTWDVKDEPKIIPPPPELDPAVEPKPATPAPAPSVVTAPDTPFEWTPGPEIDVGPLPTIGNELLPTLPIEVGGEGLGVEPPAPPLPDPIAASPRNAPGGWITDRDYKTRWIREGREGVARFNLEISASGRVSNCEVVGSTGHSALDIATCRLITRRARFEPARDSSGAKVAGTFSSSVNWQIPE